MTEQPAEPTERLRVAVGKGDPHRTMRALHAAASTLFAGSLVFGVAVVVTQDPAWYKGAVAALVLTVVLLQWAARVAAKHHDEMERALAIFAQVSVDIMRDNATATGTDQTHVWARLGDRLKAELAKENLQ